MSTTADGAGAAPNADVNNAALEQRAIEEDAAGMTEGERELAAGEIVGDRLGDEPVPGVVQDHTGIGEKISEAKTPAPMVLNTNPELQAAPAIAVHTDDSGTLSHVAVSVEQLSRWSKIMRAVRNGEETAAHELATCWHEIEHVLYLGGQDAPAHAPMTGHEAGAHETVALLDRNGETSHIAIPVASHSRLREIADYLRRLGHVPMEIVEEFERLIHHAPPA